MAVPGALLVASGVVLIFSLALSPEVWQLHWQLHWLPKIGVPP